MADFHIYRLRNSKILIEALSVPAVRWLFKKMTVEKGQNQVSVDGEHLDEFVDLIHEDDFTVEVY